MTLPVLVVSGFLGAGKTTLVNRMLLAAEGRRIAAIVNDFGSINIDAELIAERSETVLGLANGCICCSLQGDLMRTLKLLTSREEHLDHVVIEASGIADPLGIAEALQDPVLWGTVTLDAVLTLVDAEDCLTDQYRMNDPVWRAQVEGADLLVLTKTGRLDTSPLMQRLAKLSRAPVLALGGDDGPAPIDLLLGAGSGERIRPSRPVLQDDRFVAIEVESASSANMSAFRDAIEQIAPGLLRAKGIMTFDEMPGKAFVFQMAGRRATFTTFAKEATGCQLVLIGERVGFDIPAAARLISAALPDIDAGEIRVKR